MFTNTTVTKNGLSAEIAFPSEVCVGYKGKTYFETNTNLWKKGNVQEMWGEFVTWILEHNNIARIVIANDYQSRTSAKILGKTIDHFEFGRFSSNISVDNVEFRSSTMDGRMPIFFEAIITNPSEEQIQQILAFNPESCNDLPTFRCEINL